MNKYSYRIKYSNMNNMVYFNIINHIYSRQYKKLSDENIKINLFGNCSTKVPNYGLMERRNNLHEQPFEMLYEYLDFKHNTRLKSISKKITKKSGCSNFVYFTASFIFIWYYIFQ